MWANFAPYEEGQGFAESASYYFNKPLVDLTTKEYATLVAVVKSPNMFKPGTARGDKRIKRVIAIAETYNSGSHADAENFRAGETGR
jgi:membrane peptidoglycan carboxypeptidase